MNAFGLFLLAIAAAADERATISPAVATEGCLVHQVRSDLQAGASPLRVLVPDEHSSEDRLPVIYVLPVEAGRESRYGDGLAEVRKHGLHNQHRVIFVAPSFAQLPWYADHPTDPTIRQESYLLQVVVPFIEKTYSTSAQPEGRMLLGFSKSGWGAWTLLLRHPDVFGKAAAWDAPLAMDRIGQFGSAPIFGTPENFAHYEIFKLLRSRASRLAGKRRLVLTGYGNFQSHHVRTHELLDELRIGHDYRDGPRRSHDWHSGWVPEAVELLLSR